MDGGSPMCIIDSPTSYHVSPRRSPRIQQMRRRSSTPTLPRSDSLLTDGFLSPAALDVTLSARKRKRKLAVDEDDDNISILSLDMSMNEPVGKRTRKTLPKVSSLANLFSPVKPVKKFGQSLQRSLSFKNVLSPAKPAFTPYKKPQPTPTKRRPSKLWQETVNGDVTNIFSELQIRRQNAIFELYQGEEDLIEDLNMVKSTYFDSMKKLNLMTAEELDQVFSVIETLVPLHEDLVDKLRGQRRPDGYTDSIGQVVLDWLPSLNCYIPYCANQVFAKDLLDRKRQDRRVDDFLQRCQDSPFSRKLDLWSFLDVPRNRLVKYPLLFKNIQKLTPENHEDIALLEKAISLVESIISEVDTKAGEANCRFITNKLHYNDEGQKHELIDNAKTVLCEGVLRNNRGTKLTVFLLNEVIVLTRPATHQELLVYQVYRNPLPVKDITVENVKDGEVKMGSFRNNMLGQGQGSKNVFRISSQTQTGKGYSHTLQAADEHDKKQWLLCLQQATAAYKSESGSNSPSVSPTPTVTRVAPIKEEETPKSGNESDGSSIENCSPDETEDDGKPKKKRNMSVMKDKLKKLFM